MTSSAEDEREDEERFEGTSIHESSLPALVSIAFNLTAVQSTKQQCIRPKKKGIRSTRERKDK